MVFLHDRLYILSRVVRVYSHMFTQIFTSVELVFMHPSSWGRRVQTAGSFWWLERLKMQNMQNNN